MATGKRDFVDDGPADANAAPVRLAMRELRDLVRRPGFRIGLPAVLLILAVTGPFGTGEALDPPRRLVYWSLVGTATFATGMLAYATAGFAVARAGASPFLATLAGALAAGPVVTATVWLLNVAFLDGVLGTRSLAPPELGPSLVANTAVALGIGMLFRVFTGGFGGATGPDPGEAPDDASPHAPSPDIPSRTSPALRRLLDGLPPETRGPVRRLAMQDHYVEVHTLRGRGLVLMRMADAAAALEGRGLRVHRSHWVNPTHVIDAEREGDWVLAMDDGARVPVGRTYLTAVREAGLLDRRGGDGHRGPGHRGEMGGETGERTVAPADRPPTSAP